MKDFAEMFPERFSNKTNGVTPALAAGRKSPLGSNPGRDRRRLDHGFCADRKVKPLAKESAFLAGVPGAKRARKVRFIDWLKGTTDSTVDPQTIFDSQIKRIHEYKRQLLNHFPIVILYNRLRDNPGLDIPPRTFFFAGRLRQPMISRKFIIKFINNLAQNDRRRSCDARLAQGCVSAGIQCHAG